MVLVILIALVAWGLPASAQQSALQREIDELSEQIVAVEARIEELSLRADAATISFHSAESELALVEVAVEQLTREFDQSVDQLDELRTQVREFAVQQYTGEFTELDSLGSEDLTQVVLTDAFAQFAGRHQSDVVDDYRQQQADLADLEVRLDTRLSTQQQVTVDLEEVQNSIFRDLEEMGGELGLLEELVADLEAAERERQAAVAAAKAEEDRRAAEEAAAAEEEAAAVEPADADEDEDSEDADSEDPDSEDADSEEAEAPEEEEEEEPEEEDTGTPAEPIATGDWVCPVQGPASFSDTWGAPRSGGRTHKGVDMLSPEGTPVVAPVSGFVEHRGNSIGGESFHLNGDDGNYYYGTHLSAYGNSGQVEAGVIIGYVGETGNATTPHLHFEIHPGGQGAAVNPYPTVRDAC